jgi:hypothetical protein
MQTLGLKEPIVCGQAEDLVRFRVEFLNGWEQIDALAPCSAGSASR